MRRQFQHPQFIIDDGQLVVIISAIGFSSGLEICESVILLAGKVILFLISLALLPVLDPVVVLSPDSYVEKDFRLINFLLNKTIVYSVVAKVEGIQPRTMRTSDVYAQSSNAFALIG